MFRYRPSAAGSPACAHARTMAVHVAFAGCSLPKCGNASGTPRERHRNINQIFTTGSAAAKIVKDRSGFAVGHRHRPRADKPVGRRTAVAPTLIDAQDRAGAPFRDASSSALATL